MRLKTLEINGFKSFAGKSVLEFESPITCIVGPNGSGKSNVVEAIRYVLGEQSMKSMRGKTGVDLIFKGSKSLPKGTRASVSIYFDNTDKIFKLTNDAGENIDLNYNTASISRQVFPDGLNKYILNGTDVRLKDIHSLLSSVNVGSSGHHIISQGEADRILNANPKERREMIADALGLKMYQYKIKESEKKLERTNENMKEVTMLRRENAPHLNFLKKQVEKLEKGKAMQEELSVLYRGYLKREGEYIEKEKSSLQAEKRTILSELSEVSGKIAKIGEASSQAGNRKVEELRTLEKKTNELHGLKNELERKLGRIEGMIEMERERALREPEMIALSEEEIRAAVDDIRASLETAFTLESIAEVRPILMKIKATLERFDRSPHEKENTQQNLELEKSHEEILAQMKEIEAEERKTGELSQQLRAEIDAEMESMRDLEREKFNFKVRHQELSSALELVNIKESNIQGRADAFQNEKKEAIALIGEEVFEIPAGDGAASYDDMPQEELKKKIDRLKIKLEDAGLGSGADILKEYEEVSARDSFLAKELDDLTKSIESLEALIADLKEKIEVEFKNGVKKINVEFEQFFSLMFGGGTASLSIVIPEPKKKKVKSEDDEEDVEEYESEEEALEPGIEINVSLPHKKVRELHALSGGERSLTSIAILFAMSQVNPPPFLVLDETDAALDEANSRKYGDMLEKLSKHSQLIVVTHNRETMSRAGVLYGITVGSNGTSKLLSVKFEEATQIAK